MLDFQPWSDSFLKICTQDFEITSFHHHYRRSNIMSRLFKVTAVVPSQTRIRTQRELQNTYFTKLVPYENWFREQQRIQKAGGKIIKVELAIGKQNTNAGL